MGFVKVEESHKGRRIEFTVSIGKMQKSFLRKITGGMLMESPILVILAIIPAIVIIAYIFHKDKIEKVMSEWDEKSSCDDANNRK